MNNCIKIIKDNFDNNQKNYIIHHYSYELYNSNQQKILIDFLNLKIFENFTNFYKKNKNLSNTIENTKLYINSIDSKFHYFSTKIGSTYLKNLLRLNFIKNLLKKNIFIDTFLNNILNKIFLNKQINKHFLFIFDNEDVIKQFYKKYRYYLQSNYCDSWEKNYNTISSLTILPNLKKGINMINQDFFFENIYKDVQNFDKFIIDEKKMQVAINFYPNCISKTFTKKYNDKLNFRADQNPLDEKIIKRKFNIIDTMCNQSNIIKKYMVWDPNIPLFVELDRIVQIIIENNISDAEILFLINFMYKKLFVQKLENYLVNIKLKNKFKIQLKKFISDKIIFGHEKNRCINFIDLLSKKYKVYCDQSINLFQSHNLKKYDNGSINIIDSKYWDKKFCGTNDGKNIDVKFTNFSFKDDVIINHELSTIEILICNGNKKIKLIVNLIQYNIIDFLIKNGASKEYELMFGIKCENKYLMKRIIETLLKEKILKKIDQKFVLNTNIDNKTKKNISKISLTKEKKYDRFLSKDKIIQAKIMNYLKSNKSISYSILVSNVLKSLSFKMDINNIQVINQLSILEKKDLIEMNDSIVTYI